jgi:hypothetical protein
MIDFKCEEIITLILIKNTKNGIILWNLKYHKIVCSKQTNFYHIKEPMSFDITYRKSCIAFYLTSTGVGSDAGALLAVDLYEL